VVDTKLLNAFGDGAAFHHVGIGVGSIEKVSPDAVVSEDPIQKVKVAFVELNGATIELVEPLGDDSPVCRSIREGVKLLHLCYTVPDIELALQRSRTLGFRCIQSPVPAVAFNNCRIAWVFSLDYGLVELLEQHPLQDRKS
jgi:methylmalonyl-CoA/ethylmalonyl-CoA epimerase